MVRRTDFTAGKGRDCTWAARRLVAIQTMDDAFWGPTDRAATTVTPPVTSVRNSSQIAMDLRTSSNLSLNHLVGANAADQ